MDNNTLTKPSHYAKEGENVSREQLCALLFHKKQMATNLYINVDYTNVIECKKWNHLSGNLFCNTTYLMLAVTAFGNKFNL